MEKLIKRRFGKTDLYVTPISWGCAPLGNMPNAFGYEVSEEQAIETLSKALDSPINFLDTANIYGESEVRIGKTLKNLGGLPEGYIIATKADRDRKTNEFSAKQIRKSIQESCERLGLDQLQLVYLHDPEYHPSYKTNKGEVMKEMLSDDGPVAELEKLKQEGVIVNLGISGGPIDMLLEFIETGKFDAVITHNRWNLLYQVANPLIKKANELGVAIVNAAVYASGILATGTNKSTHAVYRPPSEEILGKVRKIESICQTYKVPLAAATLQFSLNDPRINSTVIGISSPEQVAETLNLAKIAIPDDFWEKIEIFAIKDEDPEGWD